MKKQLYRKSGTVVLSLLLGMTMLFAADRVRPQKEIRKPSAMDSPVVANNWKFHKIGALWNRVTNFSYMGDDAYENRTPSCDYPGGSGNS